MANTSSARSGARKPAARSRTAAKNTSAASRSRGKKTSAPRRETYSNPNDARGFFLIAFSLVCFVAYFMSREGWLFEFTAGLFGNLRILLPIQLLWLGIRALRAAKRGNDTFDWIVLPLVLGVCLLSAVQAFHVEDILAGLKIKNGYANFLTHAYDARRGGGLFGSLIGYPMQRLIAAGGSLVVYLIIAVFALNRDGLINVSAIAKTLGKGGRIAGEKLGDIGGRVGEKISETRTALANRRANDETIFDEEIYTGAGESPVKPYDLSKKSGRSVVRSVDPVGDIFEVPTEGSRRARKAGKASSASDRGTARPAGKTPDILREIENGSKEERNEKYMRDAMRPHGASPKPKLTYNYDNESPKPKKEDKTDSVFDIPAVRTADPASRSTAPLDGETEQRRQHVPQQPKPSFFESEEKPLVRQNTEQGIPSGTTYVKPQVDRNTATVQIKDTPSAVSASAQIPKAAPAPVREYQYPSMELMETGGAGISGAQDFDEEDRRRAEVLVKTLENFSIRVKLIGVSHGPAVTRYEILPAPGIKVSRISSYADDIAMALAAVSVRIEAPIPGKSAVGVEVPNSRKEVVHLRDVLEIPEARKSEKRLMVGLGKDNSGKYIVANLASMPHVLIAGQTGSGKSVCINAIIVSILYRATPEEVKMIMIDPKMVELNVYNTIPHLLVPVVTDPKKAAGALEWAVAEMERRYKVFAEKKTKNIESYNAHLEPGEERMPQIVIIIDELADLMMTSPRDVEDAINRLAQLARAAGMHLVIATQRPSVDVITGLIKANIPTRIAFTVASGVDSRTILDSYGAEKLLGRGDMLYLPPDRNKPMRIQGAWVSEDEVQAIVDHISGDGEPVFNEDMLEHLENAGKSDAEKKDKKEEEAASDTDDLFEEALRSVVEAGQASISMLQRKLRVGYARAGRLIDEMAQRGYVSNSEGSKSREVLITREQLNMIFSKDE